MDFFELICSRVSIRAYIEKPVEAEKLDQILRAANLAPSAGNLQAYEIYLVSKPAHRADLARAAFDQEFIAQAPLALVFCAHPDLSEWRYGERGAQLYCLQDAAIACTFAMLAATDLGLGSVWVGAFDELSVCRVIGAPRILRPVAILSVGYQAESPDRKKRRKLEEMVYRI